MAIETKLLSVNKWNVIDTEHGDVLGIIEKTPAGQYRVTLNTMTSYTIDLSFHNTWSQAVAVLVAGWNVTVQSHRSVSSTPVQINSA